MPIPQYLPIIISSSSALVSILSLSITYRQKSKQDTLASRKALTDTLSSIMATYSDGHSISQEPASYRTTERKRHLNSQRRYLANHAELLLKEIMSLATDIDHNIVARAFTDIGDYARAEEHWVTCTELSPSPEIKIFNLRGMARFYFNRGRFEEGRDAYDKALRVSLPDNDDGRRIRADTLAMYAAAENAHGFADEALRRKALALTEAGRIGNVARQAEVKRLVEQNWNSAVTAEPKPAGESE